MDNIYYCDCCLSENVSVTTCSKNNKCNYSMCDNCINNLITITQTNKCPNCREEIFNIIIDITEIDDIDVNLEQTTNTQPFTFMQLYKKIIEIYKKLFNIICYPCILTGLCIKNTLYLYFDFIQCIFCLHYISNKDLRKFTTFAFMILLVFLLHFFAVLTVHPIIYWIDSPKCQVICYLATSILAIIIFIASVIFSIVILLGYFHCICRDDDF